MIEWNKDVEYIDVFVNEIIEKKGERYKKCSIRFAVKQFKTEAVVTITKTLLGKKTVFKTTITGKVDIYSYVNDQMSYASSYKAMIKRKNYFTYQK
jgi:late competence protein required for DNA uptake (superfamily II DNA/RNA helicase)